MPKNKKLTVAVSPNAPFVIKRGRSFAGFDIDIWKHIAARLNLKFSFQELPLYKVFEEIKRGQAHAGLGGLTINYRQSRKVDFSYPYLDSKHHVLKTREENFNVINLIRSIFSSQSMIWIIYLLLFAFIAGHVFWAAEAGRSVSASYLPGIFEALWFSVVTLTTVGYGDIVPGGWTGRVVSLLIMVIGIGIFIIITAQLASGIAFHKLKKDDEDQKAIPKTPLKNEHYAIAFPPGGELRHKVNMALLKMKKDGSYDRIYKKWFGRT